MEHKRHHDRLWEAFKSGSKEAYAEIYEKNIHPLLNYGLKISSDNALVEDSIHDLFIDLWKSREKLSSTSSVRFYLFKALRYKICRNKKNLRYSETNSIEARMTVLKDFSFENCYADTDVKLNQLEDLKRCR